MKLIVGLGNPSEKYRYTRHNAGFIVVDKLAQDFGIKFDQQKFEGILGKGIILEEECLLFKPLTYMNLSGKAVKEVINYFKIPQSSIIVIHDDIDVPFGKVKTRLGGSDGGHKGIKSIIEECMISDFFRIKLGMGKPCINEEQQDTEEQIIRWVLSPMNEEELKILTSNMYEGVILRLKNIFKTSKISEISLS